MAAGSGAEVIGPDVAQAPSASAPPINDSSPNLRRIPLVIRRLVTLAPAPQDVFVVFSKSEPTEARFALAIKHGLEELGRFAYEYEHWSWFEQAASVAADETKCEMDPEANDEPIRKMPKSRPRRI